MTVQKVLRCCSDSEPRYGPRDATSEPKQIIFHKSTPKKVHEKAGISKKKNK